ncbi:MAG: hypothetical protein RLP44_28075 [Aggregatilineales bacterium]
MEIDASSQSKPQLLIYLLISCVLVFPASLFLFMVFNPYRLLEPFQQLIPAGLVSLAGLFVISSAIYIFKSRNFWFFSALVALLGIGALIISLLNTNNSIYESLATVSVCVGPFTTLVLVLSGLQIRRTYSQQNNTVNNWWFFFAASLTFALTIFLILGYMIQGYEVVERHSFSDRTYYLVGNSNQIYGPSIALYRCDTRGILCRQIYFGGVKSPFSEYRVDVSGETLEFSVGSSVILTEILSAED